MKHKNIRRIDSLKQQIRPSLTRVFFQRPDGTYQHEATEKDIEEAEGRVIVFVPATDADRPGR